MFVDFEGGGELEQSLYVSADELLDYRKFRVKVLRELDYLFREPKVDRVVDERAAWLPVIASAMSEPTVPD